jgi:hypothetical protein
MRATHQAEAQISHEHRRRFRRAELEESTATTATTICIEPKAGRLKKMSAEHAPNGNLRASRAAAVQLFLVAGAQQTTAILRQPRVRSSLSPFVPNKLAKTQRPPDGGRRRRWMDAVRSRQQTGRARPPARLALPPGPGRGSTREPAEAERLWASAAAAPSLFIIVRRIARPDRRTESLFSADGPLFSCARFLKRRARLRGGCCRRRRWRAQSAR